uniref:Uncharacterized protein AlNc14C68G4764 n=1 Tax=Albugo laibachii Nc14 TaxID=890382 RepID=F0WDP4_9STRA|nr:conserved hypothetical protein [Albugo laibachii Nc14]|eukprot:CCA19320.1 conserved hypothetical protein [Albugo laibachii Nc14]
MVTEDALIEQFRQFTDGMKDLHKQVVNLTRVHDSIHEFNISFGTFQTSIHLQQECLAHPEKTCKKSSLLLESVVNAKPEINTSDIILPVVNQRADNKSKKRQNTAPVKSNLKKRKRTATASQQKRNEASSQTSLSKVWTWDKSTRKKIPKKYHSKDEMDKLETLLLYLRNRAAGRNTVNGLTIADLVRHSSMSVIRCKEMLQTLMKLELITRKKEKSGFLYSLRSNTVANTL